MGVDGEDEVEDDEQQPVTRRSGRRNDVGKNNRQSRLWRILGRRVPSSEAVFVCQMILIYIVVSVSLFNLSKGNGPMHLWVALLSSAIGYSLPNPAIERKDF